jgi:carboxyl-terminal processing protease
MSRVYRKRPGFLPLILSAVLAGLVGLHVPARAAGAEKDGRPNVNNGLTAEQHRKNRESFEVVWKTVRDTHFDPKLGGVDWEGARTELRPRLEKARDMDEARAVLSELLGRLGHTHVAIIPASMYEDFQGDPARGKADQQGVPGLDVRMADGEAVVVRVSRGLPAARAGVRPGWRVHKINGESLAPMLRKVREVVKQASAVPSVQAEVVQWRLGGKEGQEITVTFLDGLGKEVSLPLRLARPEGTRVRFGHLPPMYVRFEARKVDNDIPYFYLSDFFDPLRVMKAFGDTVQENLKAEGFVLDLRGNPGGIAAMAQGLGGWFVDQPDQKLGTQTDRQGFQHYVLNPREVTYEGPLAILVDELSGSTSEILAGGLQGLKRARVFGMRTMGAALPSQFLRLPNGDGLQYVVADYVSVSGKRLEGHGVQPDEVVPVDRKALLAGRDPALDAAVRWVRSQRDSRVDAEK